MPVIRCQSCGRAYEVPPAVAVTLPTSIAPCECGDLLSGNRAALLARFAETGNLHEIDMSAFRVEAEAAPMIVERTDEAPWEAEAPRSLRLIALGADESINTVYSIGQHPLWIGRKGCQVEIDDAELSIRHCSIGQRGGELILRDADSHTGTFLDGEPVYEAVIGEGTHLIRVGSALVCIEATDEPGIPVEPVTLDTGDLMEASPQLLRKLHERAARSSATKKIVLHCIEGPLIGKDFEVPPEGVVVGREGALRVPDEFLSRKHFVLFRDPEGNLRIRDLGSRNGTFLNTLPARNAKIHPGDEIRAGVNRFRLEER